MLLWPLKSLCTTCKTWCSQTNKKKTTTVIKEETCFIFSASSSSSTRLLKVAIVHNSPGGSFLLTLYFLHLSILSKPMTTNAFFSLRPLFRSQNYIPYFILISLLKTFYVFGTSVISVQFSHSAVSDSLPPHELQHARPHYHQLPEFTQTHVHRVGDAIQPSHPLSSPSPPAPNPSQHQSLFQWVKYLHQVAKVLGVSASASVLPMNIQDWSPLGWTGWIFLQSKSLK